MVQLAALLGRLRDMMRINHGPTQLHEVGVIEGLRNAEQTHWTECSAHQKLQL